MYRVYITDCIDGLLQFIDCCNDVGDKIVAVTQNDDIYTIIYQLWDLEEE